MAAGPSNDDLYRVVSTAVDTAFYRGVYDDLQGARLDPVGHYVQIGWREGRDPAVWFSTRGYLELNPDVAEAGLNPLYHYLAVGRREGREIARSSLADRYLFERPVHQASWKFETGEPPAPTPEPGGRGQGQRGTLSAAQREMVAANFDAAFYLGANPDVAAAGQDALQHFMAAGWRERRDPSPAFAFADYLELNPDVAASGMDPFLHYLTAGRAEGRAARRALGFRYEIIADLKPLPDRLAEAERRAAVVTPQPVAELAAALSQSRSGLRDLHVTFSHDNYAANVGGVQLCLQREAARMAERGCDHLHVFPSTPWPMVRDRSPAAVGVLWNGTLVGHFAPAEVASEVSAALADVAPGSRSFAVHSLLGHAVADVLDLLRAAKLKAGYFWIHDFASLCDGFHLMRNDVADCGAPPPDSAACSVCVYGPERRRQIAAHERLFDSLDVIAVAPSEAALETWRRGWRFRTTGEVVLPHARLERRPGESAPAQPGPFRLAFLGMPAPYKGWPIFQALALRFASDPRYAFLHLSQNPAPGAQVEHHPVAVTADRPFAMREAVEGLGVDAAMIWSLCRETFSFASYEAAAAGAAVLTGPDSGNVARFVADGGHGLVLPDEAALMELFESGAILDLARAKRKPVLYDMTFSGLTVDLLPEPAR